MIIELVLCFFYFREIFICVFFKYFEVLFVLFVLSYLMVFLMFGINFVMVLDCGYRESLVLFIYEGILVLNCWGVLFLGGKVFYKELEI